MSERPKPVRLDVVRCSECAAFVDLDPLLMARDLAIVSALLQELSPRDLDKWLDRLGRKSIELCTDLGYYGYYYLQPDEPESEESPREGDEEEEPHAEEPKE